MVAQLLPRFGYFHDKDFKWVDNFPDQLGMINLCNPFCLILFSLIFYIRFTLKKKIHSAFNKRNIIPKNLFITMNSKISLDYRHIGNKIILIIFLNNILSHLYPYDFFFLVVRSN